MEPYVIPLERLGLADIEVVGGKNASLGEMIRNLAGLGVTGAGGFATTAQAYRDFLAPGRAGRRALRPLSAGSTWTTSTRLANTGRQIREWIMATPLPAAARR